MEYLCEVAKLSLLIPWHSGNGKMDFNHFTYSERVVDIMEMQLLTQVCMDDTNTLCQTAQILCSPVQLMLLTVSTCWLELIQTQISSKFSKPIQFSHLLSSKMKILRLFYLNEINITNYRLKSGIQNQFTIVISPWHFLYFFRKSLIDYRTWSVFYCVAKIQWKENKRCSALGQFGWANTEIFLNRWTNTWIGKRYWTLDHSTRMRILKKETTCMQFSSNSPYFRERDISKSMSKLF